MTELTNNIYHEISAGRSVLLVGPTNSGKTWYIKNTLIPFFNEKKIKINYFENLDVFQKPNNNSGIFIIDEIETLIDRDFLETHSTKPKSYYSKEYLKKVKEWHNKLKDLNTPSIFILTRNNQEKIDNVIDNLKVTDWGTKVKCFVVN